MLKKVKQKILDLDHVISKNPTVCPHLKVRYKLEPCSHGDVQTNQQINQRKNATSLAAVIKEQILQL